MAVSMTGPTTFEGLSAELKGPVSEGMRTALRIQAAKEAAQRAEQALKAADDLRFWVGRIGRVLKRGETCATNKWSMRGSLDAHYAVALQQLLGDPFKVSTIPNFGVHRGYVCTTW